MATDHPVDNDYFSLTAGPQPLVVTPNPPGGGRRRAPPKPDETGRSPQALLGGLRSQQGRSMLNMLPARLYTLQMGVARIARQALFIVNAPPTVRQVIVEQSADFPKHAFLVDILQPLVGLSLFNTNGEQWAQQRHMVEPSFAQAGLRRAFPLMLAAVADMNQRLDAVAAQGGHRAVGLGRRDEPRHRRHHLSRGAVAPAVGRQRAGGA